MSRRAAQSGAATGHVVLLGDSIFDNAAYVAGRPDVVRQVNRYLPDGWHATLCAVDGDIIDGVYAQIPRVPPHATHLVLSVGGNDALGHIGIVDEPAHSVGETLHRLAAIRDAFAARFTRLLDTLLQLDLNLAVCTIYEGNFPDRDLQRAAATALTTFNDVILRAAFARGLAVIELRMVCDEAADYVNAIEPSATGGDKIARVVARVIANHDFAGRRTTIYGTRRDI
jgi:lysophospholipase L1-like esterase